MGKIEEIIGHRVRDRRKAIGLSQKDLAKASGVSQQTVNIIENGKRSARRANLDAISAALGCSVDDLTLSAAPIDGDRGKAEGESPRDRESRRMRKDKDVNRTNGESNQPNAELAHAVGSEVAGRIITALESRLLPAGLSKTKNDLINAIIDGPEALASSLLASVQNIPSRSKPKNARRSRG